MVFALHANVMCTLTLKCQDAKEVRLKQQPSQVPVAMHMSAQSKTIVSGSFFSNLQYCITTLTTNHGFERVLIL